MVNASFARTMNLKPADVIVVPKFGGTIEHYVVYLGVNAWGEEIYIENAPNTGVQILTERQWLEQNKGGYVSRFRPFSGDENQRQDALKRALSLLSAEYRLMKFNCENFANYVQNGVSFSKQVNNAGSLAVAAGLLYLGHEAYKALKGK